MSKDIRQRLRDAGKTQVWLIKELAKNGIRITSPAEMSGILSETISSPKARQVIEAAEKLLDELNGHNDDQGND